ncbi:hypothetical protein BSL78_02301 [Apostichopus japonicus]|uniref:GIY-YIG domain-containing protein n=1 Tax=Stichopus japonicus TaxID=307972 RepID=A0A2G8LKF2_STIJA|nr:hypothetical protein BSL78_02301 [Apostichopus japonicus]
MGPLPTMSHFGGLTFKAVAVALVLIVAHPIELAQAQFMNGATLASCVSLTEPGFIPQPAGTNPFNITYSLSFYRPGDIIRGTERLKSVFPELPVIAFKRPSNLRDILVRASFRDDTPLGESKTETTGSSPCTQNCKTCLLVDSTGAFQSNQTKRTFQIRHKINCLSKNVIYLIYCNICNLQYIGESKNTLRMRMTQHRSAIKTKKIYQPVANHFNLQNHSIENLRVIAIDQNDSWTDKSRKAKENFWELNLKTTAPFGLNIRNDLPSQINQNNSFTITTESEN